LLCIKHFYIFSPSIFIVILVSTPFDSIPLKSVCREPSDGSHPKQSLHSIGSIIVLIVTLIWGPFGRPPTQDLSSVVLVFDTGGNCVSDTALMNPSQLVGR
jgi:hypothetical protein